MLMQKKHSCLILLDIRKAFDTVNHEILMTKVNYYGIQRNVYNSLQCYLSDQSQYVCLNNHYSNSSRINIGVPQGSFLGPLLFLIYINDMPNALNCSATLFTDDTCLLINDKNYNTLENNSNN